MKSALLITTLLITLAVCLGDTIVSSKEYIILSYIRIDIIHENGKCITKWVKVEEGAVRISVPQGSRYLFLSLDQATPFAFLSITDPLGVDVTQDVKYYGVSYITPKYAFVNLSKARLSEVTLKVVKSKSFPLIYELKTHDSASLGEIAIPPKGSKEFSINITNCVGVVLNLVMLSEGQIFLNCSSVNLVDFEFKTLEIPGIGIKNVKLFRYIIFDKYVRVVNLGNNDVIALVNMTPILITDVNYYAYRDLIVVNNSSLKAIMLNLPDFAEVIDVESGVVERYDPIFNKPLPPKLYTVYVKRVPLEVKVKFKERLLIVSNVEDRPIQKATLKLIYPSGEVKYVECKGQVAIDYELVPYVLVDVFMSGFRVSSFNLTSFPNEIVLHSQVSPLTVYCVDDKGEPLPNAQVKLFSYLSYQFLTRTTNEEGKAVFHDVPLHYNYTLIVKFRDQEVSRLTFQLETREVKVVPCNVGRINLVVCDQKNRRIGRVVLEIMSNQAKIAELTTDERGRTITLLLPFSKYEVRVLSHFLCLYEGELRVYKSGTYVIVVKSYKLVMKVKDVLGTPLSNATVSLMLANEGRKVDTKFTDYNGIVMFFNLPGESYSVKVKVGNVESDLSLKLKEDTYIEVRLFVIQVAKTVYLPLEGIIVIISIVTLLLIMVAIIKIKKRNIVIIE